MSKSWKDKAPYTEFLTVTLFLAEDNMQTVRDSTGELESRFSLLLINKRFKYENLQHWLISGKNNNSECFLFLSCL